MAGRYILTSGIFAELESLPRGVGGEIQLTDGIARLLRLEKVFAYRYAGQRYDCGSKLGFLQATVTWASSTMRWVLSSGPEWRSVHVYRGDGPRPALGI